jgi:hypothetical protein
MPTRPTAKKAATDSSQPIKIALGAIIVIALGILGWTLFASGRGNEEAAKKFEQTAVPASRPGDDPVMMPGGYNAIMKERAMQNLQQQGQVPSR